MKCNTTLVIAVLACVLCVVQAGFLEIEPHLLADDVVPYYTRDFYVRFQASGQGKKDKFCGGVRFNEKWILTAAECLDNTQYTNVRITTLTNRRHLVHHDERLLKLNYLIHAKFDNATKAHNLALVKVNYTDWNNNFVHAKLPSRNDSSRSFVNQTADITGYNMPAKPVPNKLFRSFVSVPTMPVKIEATSECERRLSPSTSEADQICTVPLTGMGFTADDVGSPLTIQDGDEYKLIGIALHVIPNLHDIVYANAFTKISPYLQWISTNTKIPIQN